MDIVQHVKDNEFDEVVLKSEQPVLVDFWAPWCGPCLRVGPILKEIAESYEGRAKVVKMNVDEETKVAGKMGVYSIPTVALFNKGKVEQIVIGLRPKAEFTQMLDKVVE